MSKGMESITEASTASLDKFSSKSISDVVAEIVGKYNYTRGNAADGLSRLFVDGKYNSSLNTILDINKAVDVPGVSLPTSTTLNDRVNDAIATSRYEAYPSIQNALLASDSSAYLNNGIMYKDGAPMTMDEFNVWGAKDANTQAASMAGAGGVKFGEDGTQIGNSQDWFGADGMLAQNKDAIGAGLGLGQLGLGLAGYLDQRKIAGKQRQLLDQQIANNKEVMANRKQRNADITATFGPRTGLAASNVK